MDTVPLLWSHCCDPTEEMLFVGGGRKDCDISALLLSISVPTKIQFWEKLKREMKC